MNVEQTDDDARREARRSYEPPAVRPLGGIVGRTQQSPGIPGGDGTGGGGTTVF